MKLGKVVMGDEAVPVEYELSTQLHNGRRRTSGSLRFTVSPPPTILKALLDLTSATLIEDDGEPRVIEFRQCNLPSLSVTFEALAPTGRGIPKTSI